MVPTPRVRWTQADGTTNVAVEARRFQQVSFRMPTEQPPPAPNPQQQQQPPATSTHAPEVQRPPATPGAANSGAAGASSQPAAVAGGGGAPTGARRTASRPTQSANQMGQRDLNSLTVGELRAMHRTIDDALNAMMDEDEENMNFVPSRFRKKPRRAGPPQFRGQQRNQLINDVHKYAGELFGIPLGATPSTTPGVGALLPAPPENPDIPPTNGVENFRYAWNRPPTNLYNQAAATNFANAMVASPRFPYTRVQFLEIRSTFLVYAGRTLKKTWDNRYVHPPNPTALFSYRQAENARGRQYRLFHSRRGVTCFIPVLNRHTALIDRLTPEGMSSDDDSTDPLTGRRFLITKKKWRSAELTEFLRTLDKLAVKLRLELRGQPSRVRVEVEDRWSAARPVYSLPRNAYLDSWFVRLVDWERDMLDAQEPYDFTFPEWIHEQLAVPDLFAMDQDP